MKLCLQLKQQQISFKDIQVTIICLYFMIYIYIYMKIAVFLYIHEPVHSLLFVKSIPTIRLDDSRPSFLKASVTCKRNEPNTTCTMTVHLSNLHYIVRMHKHTLIIILLFKFISSILNLHIFYNTANRIFR